MIKKIIVKNTKKNILFKATKNQQYISNKKIARKISL